MAKKPAESDSDETGSASESASRSEPLGSGSEATTKSDEEGSGAGSGEAAASDESSSPPEEAPKKKGGVSARGKKATGKHAAVKPSARAAAPRPRGSGHELVPVICSECYEELVFDSGVRSDVLTCPICEHQAARPDDAQLAVIAEKRKQESTNFLIGLVLCIVSVLAFFLWIWMLRNPHTNANENGGAFYGPMAISLLTYIGCLAFTLGKYEGARHDVYF
jgi:hypothetical protein